MDVFDASKTEDHKAGRLTNAEAAAEWLRDYFEDRGDAPLKIRDIEGAAQEADRWFSKGTFDRARELAGVGEGRHGEAQDDPRRGVRLASR